MIGWYVTIGTRSSNQSRPHVRSSIKTCSRDPAFGESFDLIVNFHKDIVEVGLSLSLYLSLSLAIYNL